MTPLYDLTIVGTGITALALSSRFPNKKVLLIEKSRGLGGRIATRRLGDFWIDHGAETFDLKHAGLKALMESYDPSLSTNHWVKELAQGLEILKECRVKKLVQTSEGLEVWDEKNQHVCTCRKMIITAPAPQARDILEASGLEADFLNNVEYDSSIQFLLLLSHELTSTQEHSALFDLKKKSTTKNQSFLYHFELKANLLSRYLETDKDELKKMFLQEMNLTGVIESHVHKWRYSRVIKSIDARFQRTFESEGILLAGDYFFGNDLNAALESVENITKNGLPSL